MHARLQQRRAPVEILELEHRPGRIAAFARLLHPRVGGSLIAAAQSVGRLLRLVDRVLLFAFCGRGRLVTQWYLLRRLSNSVLLAAKRFWVVGLFAQSLPVGFLDAAQL